MNQKSKTPEDHPCQLFEFLLRMTRGTEVVAYALPIEDADCLSDLFSQMNALDSSRTFLDFASVSGRSIHLNLNFLLGVSRLEVVGRAGDRIKRSPCQTESAAGIRDWQSFSEASDPPDAAFFIHGFSKPLLCQELDRDEIALAATLLEEEPATGMLSLSDEENLRTRLIPARQVILMDSLAYHEAELPSADTERG